MLKNRRSFLGFETRMTTDRTSSLPSPAPAQSQTTSPDSSNFMGSFPRIFNGFLPRKAESAGMSPTSILDTKPFSSSNLVNPLIGHDKHLFKSPNNPSSLDHHNNNNNKHPFEKVDGVGLAIVDSLTSGKNEARYLCSNPCSSESKMVLFGAKLKVQIPTLPSSPALISPAATTTPKSPADFGIKTRNSQHLSCGFWSPMKAKHSPHELPGKGLSLSPSEMELSEDYTCVITHGPNPKTTHIFDDCVLENCCGVVKLSDLGKDGAFSADHPASLQ